MDTPDTHDTRFCFKNPHQRSGVHLLNITNRPLAGNHRTKPVSLSCSSDAQPWAAPLAKQAILDLLHVCLNVYKQLNHYVPLLLGLNQIIHFYSKQISQPAVQGTFSIFNNSSSMDLYIWYQCSRGKHRFSLPCYCVSLIPLFLCFLFLSQSHCSRTKN